MVQTTRKIIEHIEGVELAHQDPEQSGRWSTCCGGGGLEATHPELSERMGMRRADQLLKAKPSITLSACSACDLQLCRMVKKTRSFRKGS